jgi:putative sigma-54 modulation protein
MRLRLAARGVELSTELKDYVRLRIHFSLGRFAGKIRSLSIRLADVNGPRGGVDKACDIRVDVGLRQQVAVRERQASVYAAVAFALDRAERAVQRQLKSASAGTGMETARTVRSPEHSQRPPVRPNRT